MRISSDAVARRDPEHGEQAGERAERDVRRRRPAPPTHAAASATGSVRKTRAASRQLPKAACRSRKIPIAAATREADEPRHGRPASLGGVAEHLAWYSSGNATSPSALARRRLRRRRRSRPLDVGADVDAARDGLVAGSTVGVGRDRARRPRRRGARGRRRACRSAGRGRSSRLCARRRACPRRRRRRPSAARRGCRPRCPDEQRGRRAAHVARLDAVAAAPRRGRPRSRPSAADWALRTVDAPSTPSIAARRPAADLARPWRASTSEVLRRRRGRRASLARRRGVERRDVAVAPRRSATLARRGPGSRRRPARSRPTSRRSRRRGRW